MSEEETKTESVAALPPPEAQDSVGPLTIVQEENRTISPKVWKWMLSIFVGLLILACAGQCDLFIRWALYARADEFLSDSAGTSQILFATFSLLKGLVAMVGDVPILGGIVEPLQDLIDYSWWGCFISMVVLRALQFFMSFVTYCGKWPSVIFALTGCIFAWTQLCGFRWVALRKTLIVIQVAFVGLYILAPLSTICVAYTVRGIENLRGNTLQEAKAVLEDAWKEENKPDYLDHGIAWLRHKLPVKWFSSSEEEWLITSREFTKKHDAFIAKNEQALGQITKACSLYLAEKAIACFFFPFAFLWAIHFALKKGGAWLNAPFEVKYRTLIMRPEALTNENLKKTAQEVAQKYAEAKAKKAAATPPETPPDAPSGTPPTEMA